MTSCLLKNDPVSYRTPTSLIRLIGGGGAVKASPNWALEQQAVDPKPGRANHEQGEVPRNRNGGPNSSELQICEMTCG